MNRTILGLLLPMVLAQGGATAHADSPAAASEGVLELRVRPVLAGKCVQCHGDFSHRVSDEYGGAPAEDPVHVHDFHATIRHLMGPHHTRLTDRDSGRDFRLTDISGNVVKQVIA
jgi:hypothetical protein